MGVRSCWRVPGTGLPGWALLLLGEGHLLTAPPGVPHFGVSPCSPVWPGNTPLPWTPLAVLLALSLRHLTGDPNLVPVGGAGSRAVQISPSAGLAVSLAPPSVVLACLHPSSARLYPFLVICNTETDFGIRVNQPTGAGHISGVGGLWDASSSHREGLADSPTQQGGCCEGRVCHSGACHLSPPTCRTQVRVSGAMSCWSLLTYVHPP